jgi:hypothetical protein
VKHSLVVENDDDTLERKKCYCWVTFGGYVDVSVSVVKSSMGFGGGVVAMV